MPERQTKATQERHERMLLELLKEPGNDRCADCRARNPRWASYSLGVFLCIRCAGLHRKMGTHISRVKSVTMDQWTLEQIDMIRKNGGNDKVNSIVNPHPDRHPLPIGDDDDDRAMEKYVRQKWEKREFMDMPTMPPRPSTLHPNAHMKSLPKRSSSVPVLVRSEGDYSAAMARLAEMGFKDIEKNKYVLQQTQGNLQAAVEILSRLSSAQTPLTSSAFHLSDEQKLVRLQELGFSDPNANRDALRRSGGNLEVAVDILQASRKAAATPVIAEAPKLSAFTDTTNTTSQELAGRAQTASERQSHKLSGGKVGTLVDIDVSSQTTAAASATTNMSNPFHSSFQPQPQQQPFVQQTGNPFSQISNPMPMNTTTLSTSPSAALHPQLTGYVQQSNSSQPFLGLQPQMTGIAPSSPNMNTIQPTPTGSSNPFSQMTGSTSSMTSTTSNIFQNQFAPPQRSYTAPSFPVASSPFSSMSSGSSLQIPQQQQQPGMIGNQSMPNFGSAISSQPTGFQGNNVFALSPAAVTHSNSNNPWASQNIGGGGSSFL